MLGFRWVILTDTLQENKKIARLQETYKQRKKKGYTSVDTHKDREENKTIRDPNQ